MISSKLTLCAARTVGTVVTARRYLRVSVPRRVEGVRAAAQQGKWQGEYRASERSPVAPLLPHDLLDDASVVERVLETDDVANWVSESQRCEDGSFGLHSPLVEADDAPSHPQNHQPSGTIHWEASGRGGGERSGAEWTIQRVERVLGEYKRWLHLSSEWHYLSTSSATASMSEADLVVVSGCLDFCLRCDASHRAQLLHSATQLAYVAGFHRRCVELFLVDHIVSPALAQMPLNHACTHDDGSAGQSFPHDGDRTFVPSYVLAAAVHCRDNTLLHHVAKIVLVSCTWDDEHGARSSASTDTSCAESDPLAHAHARVGTPDAQLLRLYAHAICACQRTEDDARALHHDDKQPSTTQDGFHTALLQVAHACAQRLLSGQRSPVTAEGLVRASMRCALYAGDRESTRQASVFLHVFRLLAQQAEKNQPTASVCTWLNVSLLSLVMRSSILARRWDHVEYYTLYMDALFENSALEGLATLTRQEEGLVMLFLRYATATRQWPRCLEWIRRITRQFPDYLPSIDVAAQAARVAMAVPDASLATWSLETVLAAGQLTPPSSHDLLVCLSAVARCGLPTFPHVLRSCIDSELVALTEEELLYVQLLHCRRSVRWRDEVEALVGAFLPRDDKGGAPRASPSFVATPTSSAVLSSRNLYQLLLILQEGEHPDFMLYYRLFLTAFAAQMSLEERGRWAIFALTWTTLRCGNVSVDDVLYTAQEALQIWCVHSGACSSSQERPTLAPDTQRSLLAKWAVLKSQHSDAWWTQRLRSPVESAGSPSPLSAHQSPGVISTFLTSATRLSSTVVVPSAARFLKRPSLLHLQSLSI